MNPVKHILPITTIRRERRLPAAGKVVVRAGQKLGAMDIIAEANLAPEYLLLDVARGLGVSAERADGYITCHAGDQLAAGDMIAGPVGFVRRVIRTPVDGKVSLTGSGQVLLEIANRPFQLKAGIPGEVVDLIPDLGAVIETEGALVQGVWGNGKIDSGTLRILIKQPDEETRPADLDVSLRGALVMAGHCRESEVLTAAAELPLRGLILSSMEARLIPTAEKLPIPVVVLEGFGWFTYNQPAYQLLTTNDERMAALNAEIGEGFARERPEIVIPLPAPSSVSIAPEVMPPSVRQKVRIVRAPNAGETGVITAMKGKVIFPSGIRTLGVEVRLDNNQSVIIPAENIEVIA